MIKKLIKIFWIAWKKGLDLIFPRFCVGCNKEISSADGWLCFDCTQKIIPVVSQVCPQCGRLSDRGMYHESCSKGKSLKGIIAAAYFEEGPVREMIHNFKYNGVIELVIPLAELMTQALRVNGNWLIEKRNRYRNKKKENYQLISNFQSPYRFPISFNQFLITFTPLYWRRQAQRGYNQSELLAQEVSKRVNLPVIDLLIKTKQTKRQADLSGKERRENLKQVFKAKSEKLKVIKGKTIILIDDVYTTGSTLNECGRVLKKAGAKAIWGLVISRG